MLDQYFGNSNLWPLLVVGMILTHAILSSTRARNWVPENVLMYVINDDLYYFVPYYSETATTLAPAMIIAIDALTQRVGFYEISNPQDAIQVGEGTARAYANLVGQQAS